MHREVQTGIVYLMKVSFDVGIRVFFQYVQLDSAVAVVAAGDRALHRHARALLRSTANTHPAVGNQQVHEEASRAKRHSKQRAARLLVTCAFR